LTLVNCAIVADGALFVTDCATCSVADAGFIVDSATLVVVNGTSYVVVDEACVVVIDKARIGAEVATLVVVDDPASAVGKGAWKN